MFFTGTLVATQFCCQVLVTPGIAALILDAPHIFALLSRERPVLSSFKRCLCLSNEYQVSACKNGPEYVTKPNCIEIF